MPEVLDITLGETVRLVHKGFPRLMIPDPGTVGRKDMPIQYVLAPESQRQAPLRLKWAGRDYVIHYDKDLYVPFDCVKLYFGDPRAGLAVNRITDRFNQDMIVPDRLYEIQRLRYLWQSSEPVFREYIPGDRSLLDEPISDRIPDVEVYALTGDRIFMVVDDPHGDRILAATPTVAQEQYRDAQLLQQSETIVEQQRTIAALMKKLDIRPEDLTLDEDTDVTVDKKAPRKHAGKAEAPEDATVTENPAMVYDQRTRQVRPKTERRTPDPTRLEELPVDGQ